MSVGTLCTILVARLIASASDMLVKPRSLTISCAATASIGWPDSNANMLSRKLSSFVCASASLIRPVRLFRTSWVGLV